jgi:ubiquinone/menaquinone biosynthesis C-methylase UbiE
MGDMEVTAMATTHTFEQMKDQVRKDWTDNSRAWRKWNDKFQTMTAAATDAVVEAARLVPGMNVLDLASGTGEPALSVARAVGPSGRVTATDLVPEMLEVVRDNVRAARLENVTVEVADIEALPYDDGAFDRVTSRFGVMFCPNIPRALGQIRRVLRPAGRVSLLVWAPPAQPFFSWMAPFQKRAQLPPPPPEAPSPFRFAKPGSLTEALVGVGFHEVVETPRTLRWTWPGPAEESWTMQQEVVPQLLERFRGALNADDFAAASSEAAAAIGALEAGGQTHFDIQVYVVTASR